MKNIIAGIRVGIHILFLGILFIISVFVFLLINWVVFNNGNADTRFITATNIFSWAILTAFLSKFIFYYDIYKGDTNARI